MNQQKSDNKKSKIFQRLDLAFRFIPLIFVVVLIYQTIYAIILNGPFISFRMFGLDIFSDIFNIGTGTLHASTVLIGFSFWIFVYILLRKKPTSVQITMASAMPVLGLLFYDFSHTMIIFFLLNRGNPLIQLSLVGVCYLLIHFYNLKYKFLKINILFPILLCLYFLASVVLIYSGFFDQLGTEGTDPHGWLWFITKFICVWMWVGIISIKRQPSCT